MSMFDDENEAEEPTDELYQQYLQDPNFKGSYDEYKKIHESVKTEEAKSKGTLIKHSVSISIKKENDQIISKFDGSCIDGPIVENIIAATLGNCPKNGDFFNFTFTMEEDGSINVNMHVPSNNSTKTIAVAENWIKDEKIEMSNNSLPIPVSLLKILAAIGAVTNDELKGGVTSLLMAKNPMSPSLTGMFGNNRNPFGGFGH